MTRKVRSATPARWSLRLHKVNVLGLPMLAVGCIDLKVLRTVISSLMVSMVDHLSRAQSST